MSRESPASSDPNIQAGAYILGLEPQIPMPEKVANLCNALGASESALTGKGAGHGSGCTSEGTDFAGGKTTTSLSRVGPDRTFLYAQEGRLRTETITTM